MKRLILLFVLVAAIARGDLLTSLVSYWNLNEVSGTRSDSTATANTLTDNNSTGSGTGIISNAASFASASTNFLSHASNSTLQMGSNTSFTISLWVKISSVPGDTILLAKDDSATNSREYVFDVDSGVGLRFYVFDAAQALYIVTDGTGISPSVGVWYFIVGWYDSSNGQVHMKVNNGTQQDGTSGAAGANTSSATFEIGARSYSGFQGYFDGLIDEVGIWKRVLTGTEMTNLYNSGAGLTYPFGIVGGSPTPGSNRFFLFPQ